MKELLLKTQSILGIDGAISYTLLGKGVGAIVTVFTVFFIARFLSPSEQGYYYTFGSLLSIQIFFELGLNNIITQFVAHEYSYLDIANKSLSGPKRNLSRLAYLLKFCIKWYAFFAVVMMAILIVVGIYFFHRNDNAENVSWVLPWVLLVVATVINFLASPINSYVQGLGKVKEIAAIRFWQQIVNPIIVWGGLMLGAKLYVSALNVILVVVVNVYFYYKYSFIKILYNILKVKITDTVNYMAEIFPFQWKIALSWISGFFTFQLFNPVLFASEGAVAAGKMGMTISAASAIQGVLLSWINTKVPLLSGLIEQKHYKELDEVFHANLKRMIWLGVLLYVSFFVMIYYLQESDGNLYEFGQRFLDMIPLAIMSIAIGLQVPVTAWATYLRCFLKEPFLINSVTLGTLSLISALILGSYYGTIGLSCGYLSIQLLSVCWAYYIFITKKEEYQR